MSTASGADESEDDRIWCLARIDPRGIALQPAPCEVVLVPDGNEPPTFHVWARTGAEAVDDVVGWLLEHGVVTYEWNAGLQGLFARARARRSSPLAPRWMELVNRFTITADGPVRLVLAGPRHRVQQVCGDLAEMHVDARIEVARVERMAADDEVGLPHGRPAPPEAILARSDQRLLATARHLGYFEVPRRITLRELSAEVGLAPATVSERLRRAQSTLVDLYFDGMGGPPPADPADAAPSNWPRPAPRREGRDGRASPG